MYVTKIPCRTFFDVRSVNYTVSSTVDPWRTDELTTETECMSQTRRDIWKYRLHLCS